MDKLIIKGGVPLIGEVSVSGAKKNSKGGNTYCDACFSGEYPIAVNS